MVCIEAGLFLWSALLVMLLPLPWLLSSILAALIHELSHIAVLLLLGGNVTGIRIHPGGAQIEAGLTGWKKNLLAILAGPAASLLLMFLCHRQPKLSACGLLQGLYNLLPVRPLDGGRALEILLIRFLPRHTERILFYVQIGIFFLSVVAAIFHPAGIALILMALFPAFGKIPRNIPCKRK